MFLMFVVMIIFWRYAPTANSLKDSTGTIDFLFVFQIFSSNSNLRRTELIEKLYICEGKDILSTFIGLLRGFSELNVV